MARKQDVRILLSATTMPAAVVDSLLDRASELWLAGAPADVLAADLALCHPLPRRDEARSHVRRHPTRPEWRVTLLAADRAGLLATTAGVFAARGLSIASVTATTLPEHGFALQRLHVTDPLGRWFGASEWSEICATLEAALRGDVSPGEIQHPELPANADVKVAFDSIGGGRTLVTVQAPDVVGLFWSLTTWLREHCGNIEFAKASSRCGFVDDVLVVDGPVDGTALDAHLRSLVGGGPCVVGTDRVTRRIAGRVANTAKAVAHRVSPRRAGS